jgi:putative ABC transport system permease protein
MWKVALKGVLGRKLRLALTAVAVVLGVGFMAGTMVFTETIKKAFDGLFADINEGTDAIVRSARQIENPFGGEERANIPDSVLDAVRAAPGVDGAEGAVQGWAVMVDRDGDAINAASQGPPPLGVAWTYNDALNPLELAEGRAPGLEKEVVIDKGTADDNDFAVRDEIRILTQAGSDVYTISGIARFGDTDRPLGASIAAFTPETAQRVLDTPGEWNLIQVVADEGVSQEELRDGLRDALTERGIPTAVPDAEGEVPDAAVLETLTGDQFTDEQQDDLAENLSFINTFLLVFAVVALVVGAFVIYNSFSITVAQRQREMALLRAIGARRRQVLGAVMVEAVLTGLVASAVGLLAGIGLAVGLKALFGALGLDIPAVGTVISPSTVITSIVVGVVVTLVAAVLPARRASKVPPIAALRDVAIGEQQRPGVRTAAGLAVLVLSVLVIGRGLFGDVDNPLPLVGVGALGVFVGVAILGPVIAPTFARLLGARPVGYLVVMLGLAVFAGGVAAVVAGIADANVAAVVAGVLVLLFAWAYVRSGVAASGMSGKLGRENALRSPKRTARTAAALMIGVGLVAFITVFVASLRASVETIIDDQVDADFLVNAGFGFAGLSPELSERLADVPGVRAVGGVRGGPVEVFEPDSDPADPPVRQISAVDPATGEELWDLGFVEGEATDVTAGTIAVFDERAEDLGIALDDRLDVEFIDGGRQTLRVTAIYSNNELAGDYFVSLDTWESNVKNQFDFLVAIRAADGTDLDALREDLQVIVDDYPNGELQDQDEFKDAQADQLNAIINLVYGLLAFAIIISAFGIANTLALSIFERTRELGLLRAVGMSRSQVRRTVRWEAVIVALFGTLLGIVIGIFLSWILVLALESEGFGEFALPPAQVAAVVVLGAGVGVLSALLPAYRASRLDMLEAISTE